MGKTATVARGLLDQIEAPRQLRSVDYLRVSTEQQAKGFGIPYAAKKTGAYIAKKGWKHIDTFKDPGVSGSLEAHERPDLKRLMELARQTPRPFDVVVVPESRAIGRTDRAYYRWVWELQDLGIFVADAKRGIDNTTEAGEDAMREEADYAFKEYKRIRDRTQGGIQEKAEAGGYAGGRPRYGYRIENQGQTGESRLAIDICDCPGDCTKTHEAVVLRRARVLVIEHRGNWQKAALQLNAERLYTRSGKPWRRDNLRTKLMNEDLLAGRMVWRNPKNKKRGKHRGVSIGSDGGSMFGETITIDLEPMFTPEEVSALRKVLRPRSQSRGQRVYPLTRRLFSICGKHYVGGGHDIRHYRCSGKMEEYAGAPICSCPQLDADSLDAAVWGEVCNMLGDSARLNRLAKLQAAKHQGGRIDYEKRISEFNRQIEEQQNAIALTMAVAAKQAAARQLDPETAEKVVEKAIKPLNDELADLERLLAEAITWQQESAAAEERARDLLALSKMAHERLEMAQPVDQERFLELLEIKARVLGEADSRKPGTPCALADWFRSRGRAVPHLTDDVWEKVEPLMTGHWKLDPRHLLRGILYKARTGEPWTRAYELFDCRSLRMYWGRWMKSGLWEEIMDRLADVDGVPVPDGPSLVPPLEVTGAIRPRVLLDSERHLLESCRSASFSDVSIRFKTKLHT